MFKISNHAQGTDEWHLDRLGKITASIFDQIVTKTGKPSSSMDSVVNRAVAELVMKKPDEFFCSDAMLRGKELEDKALGFFNFSSGHNFEKCGFIDSENGYGCSPDGIDLSKKLGLELKCPLPHTHLGYLCGDIVPSNYFQQLQFSLIVTEYDKWIFGSYCPGMPCLIKEAGRDEKFIKLATPILEDCCEKIKERFEYMVNLMEIGDVG
jgi:hypothetical protein